MVRPDPRQHGDVSEWPIGLMFADREDLSLSGLHAPTQAGIFGTKADNGAFSIVLNQGYEDDEDNGDIIIYTGEGKGKPKDGQEVKAGLQLGDQDMNSPGNAALKQSVLSKLPVRVIRGPEGNVNYAPLAGYRYDGLYDVVNATMETGKAGFKMCKFELRRCEEIQAPLPLHVTGARTDKWWSPDGIKVLTDKQPPVSSAPVRTVEERNREITGHQKYAGFRFKKSKSSNS
ncbi:PUA-like domain-containing protein [Mycena rebaudengoi]|nr:PUA-like domain-containing protein [Mycena rebaudengoi]